MLYTLRFIIRPAVPDSCDEVVAVLKSTLSKVMLDLVGVTCGTPTSVVSITDATFLSKENVTYTMLAFRTGLITLFVEDLQASGSLTCNSTVTLLPTSSLDATDQFSCDGLGSVGLGRPFAEPSLCCAPEHSAEESSEESSSEEESSEEESSGTGEESSSGEASGEESSGGGSLPSDGSVISLAISSKTSCDTALSVVRDLLTIREIPDPVWEACAVLRPAEGGVSFYNLTYVWGELSAAYDAQQLLEEQDLGLAINTAVAAPCGSLVYAAVKGWREVDYMYTGFGCLDEMYSTPQALTDFVALNDNGDMCCGVLPGPSPPPAYPATTTALELHVQTDLSCDAATLALRQVIADLGLNLSVVEPVTDGNLEIYIANGVFCEPDDSTDNGMKLTVLLTQPNAADTLVFLLSTGSAAHLTQALHSPCNSTVGCVVQADFALDKPVPDILPTTAIGCTTASAAAAASAGGWGGGATPKLVALEPLCCAAPIEGASAYVLVASQGGTCEGAKAGLMAAVTVAGVASSLRPTVLIFGGVPYYGILSCNETKAWDGTSSQVVAKVGLSSRKAAMQVVDLLTNPNQAGLRVFVKVLAPKCGTVLQVRLGSAHGDVPPQDTLAHCSSLEWTNDTVVFIYQEERLSPPPPMPPQPAPLMSTNGTTSSPVKSTGSMGGAPCDSPPPVVTATATMASTVTTAANITTSPDSTVVKIVKTPSLCCGSPPPPPAPPPPIIQPTGGSSLVVAVYLPVRFTCAELNQALMTGLGLLGVADNDLPIDWTCIDTGALTHLVAVHFPAADMAAAVLDALHGLPEVTWSIINAWLDKCGSAFWLSAVNGNVQLQGGSVASSTASQVAVSRGGEGGSAGTPGVTRFTVASASSTASSSTSQAQQQQVTAVPFSPTFRVPLNLFSFFPNLLIACPKQLATTEFQGLVKASKSNVTSVDGLCCSSSESPADAGTRRRSLVDSSAAAAASSAAMQANVGAAKQQKQQKQEMVCQPLSPFFRAIGYYGSRPDGWACERSGGAWTREACGCPDEHVGVGRYMCCRVAGVAPRQQQGAAMKLSGWVRRVLRVG